MIRFKQLPNWCITNILPAFYDFESLTAIEQTGRLYSTLQSLIEDYNKFANEVNTTINEFMESSSKNEEEFVCKINKIMHDYIMKIDEKIKMQDSVIAKAVDYMKTNLAGTLQGLLVEMRESGELGEIVLETFDAFTSRLVTLETKIPDMETDISNLKQKTNDIEGNISNIETNLTDVSNRFIPTKTSDLQNDSDFVNSDYVQQEIATFDFIKVVDSLPTEGLENRVYFVPKTDTQSQDLFDEYAWINGKWEWITTKQLEVDLTPYPKTNELLEMLYPVGKVEVFFDAIDHSNHLGFTWERTSVGRVPVGIDTTQSEFATIGQKGGSKDLQEHVHKLKTQIDTDFMGFSHGGYDGSSVGWKIDTTNSTQNTYAELLATETGSAGTGDSGNLQPYEVMAFWKRVA